MLSALKTRTLELSHRSGENCCEVIDICLPVDTHILLSRKYKCVIYVFNCVHFNVLFLKYVTYISCDKKVEKISGEHSMFAEIV